MMPEQDKEILRTQAWLDKIVIGLNLCPFAKKERVKDAIRFQLSCSIKQEEILQDLLDELNFLQHNDHIETTLLILSKALSDFAVYNQFLDLADMLIAQSGLDGVFQIASFHPDYQFADTQVDDVENYTNRSPYPILHILREDSLANAIEKYPDTALIPGNNIRLMNSLGLDKLKELYT